MILTKFFIHTIQKFRSINDKLDYFKHVQHLKLNISLQIKLSYIAQVYF